MASVKNNDNQIVVPLPIWMRIIAGLCAAFGIGVFAIIVLTAWNRTGLGVALGFLLFGIFFLGLLGLTVKVTFEKALGKITIRKCIWSLPYRTRCISKKEVQSATTTWSTEYGFAFDTYGVSIPVSGRKKPVKIGDFSRKSANYLADRINAFILADRIDPFIRFE